MDYTKSLVFTIATNGYDKIFQGNLYSQEAYAQKYNYRYVAFTKEPRQGISATNSAWLKVPLILHALKKGYQAILFIDADAFIRDHAPPFESVFCENKYIYMSLGSSGRFNSGVIIVRNSQEAKNFFSKLLWMSNVPSCMLPQSDQCLYENGHVINLAKKSNFVQIIDPKWNYTYNTILPEDGQEYICHGKGTWNLKPRAQQKSIYYQSLMTKLLSIYEGPRYFQLKKLLSFYEREYQL